jgi:hypothetical protein
VKLIRLVQLPQPVQPPELELALALSAPPRRAAVQA